MKLLSLFSDPLPTGIAPTAPRVESVTLSAEHGSDHAALTAFVLALQKRSTAGVGCALDRLVKDADQTPEKP